MKKLLTALFIVFALLALSGCQNNNVTMSLNAGQDTVEVNTPWTDAGAVIDDNGTEYAMTATGSVDITTPGTYTVVYAYTIGDTEYTISRKVIVQDQTAPTISLKPGTDTVKVGTAWLDAGVDVSDNSGTYTVTVSGTVNTDVAGSYQITYTAIDAAGNTASVVRFVNVIE